MQKEIEKSAQSHCLVCPFWATVQMMPHNMVDVVDLVEDDLLRLWM